jgi:hypothetical protein
VDVSVVVCTYNRAEMLRDTLPSIVVQRTAGLFSYEVVVVDDASTDQTSLVIREMAGVSPVPVRYARGEGKGVAAARNRGIAESKGEWIAFTDDDQLAEANWLSELVAAAGRTGADCVGGIVPLKLSGQGPSAIPPVCRACLRETVAVTEERKRDRKNFPVTGNSLIRRRVFDSIGCFDESLTLGGEDLDFLRRVRKAGLDIWQTPRAVLHHLVPPYRLREDYLRWNALRNGVCFAHMDLREHGLLGAALLCAARIGKSLLLTVPCYCWACLRRDESQRLGQGCQLSKLEGYVRKVLSTAGPRAFAQERFFSGLEMRKESESFDAGDSYDSLLPPSERMGCDPPARDVRQSLSD